MELPQLIQALARPEAYPHPAADVQVCQTHISVVFLAGPFAYKIKKPVQFGFVDFSTLERRRHFCEEEVRLNRRLAGEVYQGVVPVTTAGQEVRMGGTGAVIEWAVKMQRLPEEATLAVHVRRGGAGQEVIEALARRLAAFHVSLPSGADTKGHGSFPAVAQNARDNLSQAAALVGTTISRAVWERLSRRTEAELTRLRPVIEARAARGKPRDTHGDLHLDHVYLFPGRPPPADLVIVDCIEFNERLRFADPVADMAFLVMDLVAHGRPELARAFADTYFGAAGDSEGRALLPFYMAYRAAVRGKVEGLKLSETEVPAAERQAALGRARARWLLALGLLETPDTRPALVLVAGLPGSGKSTLARALAEHAGLEVIRSDVVRKELAGSESGTAIYTPAWTWRTYAECLRRAEALLFEGQRVLVDANFRREEQRQPFVQAAAAWAVPLVVLICRATSAAARQRLAGRHGDASDADWSVYEQLAAQWQEPGPATRPHCRDIPTTGTPEEALDEAVGTLRARFADALSGRHG
jgi:aminoglycoside phosphotransferase family enzyme/predicted kinase